EALVQMAGKAKNVPRLRPRDLGALAHYFYETGEALPQLHKLREGLMEHKLSSLELCAPASVLAQLLEAERTVHTISPALTRARLRKLRAFWQVLWPRAGEDEVAAARGFNSSRVGPGPGERMKTIRRLVWRDGSRDWFNVTRSAIATALVRVDAQVRQVASESMARARRGFEAHVIVPYCARHDEQDLERLTMSFQEVPQVKQ
ncbi:unnamed protein product, partial [Polarella glacialis]